MLLTRTSIRKSTATSTVQGTVKQHTLTKNANHHQIRIDEMLDRLSPKAHACVNQQLFLRDYENEQLKQIV